MHKRSLKDLSASWMKCPTCSNMFAPKELSVHIEEDHSASTQIRYIPCPICSCKKTKPELVEHINTKHKHLPPTSTYSICNTVLETCRKCSKVFTCKYDLRGHMENVHNSKTCVPCFMCEEVVLRESLSRHITNHDDISCPICDFVAKKRKLVIHINSEHDSLELDEKIDIFEPMLKLCGICCKVFKDTRNLKRHTQTVHNPDTEGKIVCLICFHESPNRSKMRDHIMRHERRKFQDENLKPRKRVLCSQCGASFMNNYSLQWHIKFVHTLEKKIPCQICGKAFKAERNLAMHFMNLHSETRPPPKYICSTCGKTFRMNAHYKNHMATHSDERPYDCTVCGSQFKTKGALAWHKGTHASRSHACSVCGKAFSRNFHLTVHMRGHTGERPYACLICGKAFTQNCLLKLHMKTYHSASDIK